MTKRATVMISALLFCIVFAWVWAQYSLWNTCDPSYGFTGLASVQTSRCRLLWPLGSETVSTIRDGGLLLRSDADPGIDDHAQTTVTHDFYFWRSSVTIKGTKA